MKIQAISEVIEVPDEVLHHLQDDEGGMYQRAVTEWAPRTRTDGWSYEVKAIIKWVEVK